MDDYRAAVVTELFGLIAAHADLADVQVEAGDPGADTRAEAIWADAVGNDGDWSVPVAGPDPLVYVDEWRLPIHVVCAPKGRVSLTDCRIRLGEMAASVVDVVRNNADLVGSESDTYVIEHVLLLNRSDDVWRTEAGPVGQSLITVSVRSRLL